MNIRHALTKDDIDAIAYMAYPFTTESKFVKVIPERLKESYWEMMANGLATMFMLEDETGKLIGALGAIKYPDLHSGELTSVETFWYVEKENRGHGLLLLDAYEAWAKRQGCVKCAMIHMVDSMPDKLAVLYKRRGYELIEKHYVKELPL